MKINGGVISKVVAGYGYEDGLLRVILKNGKVYDYLNVPIDAVGLFGQDFGITYNAVIKKKYACIPRPDLYGLLKWVVEG